MRIATPLLAALLLSTSLLGSQPPPLAIEALDSLNSFKDEEWSYTKTTRSKEGTKVERHDASHPEGERWTLVTLDGSPPTARQHEEYKREKAKESVQRAEKSEKDEHDVDRSSIRLVEEDSERAIFSFRTKSEGRLEARVTKNILGTLVVNKDGGWAEELAIRNTDPLKPIPGVSVSKLNLTMTFRQHEATGEIVPEAIELEMRGRAFLVKSLDEDRTSRYSDFQRLGGNRRSP